MYDDLAASRYLMQAYAKASDSWETFRDTGDPEALNEAVVALAAAWTALTDDDGFWADADAVVASGMRKGEVAAELEAYTDTDKLLARELGVLVEAGMQPVHATRVVVDLSEVLPARIEPLRPDHVDDLRARAPELAGKLRDLRDTQAVMQESLIAGTERGQPIHGVFVRGVRRVGKALKATAGAAAVVANAAGAVASLGVASGFALGSVLGGLGAMFISTADALDRPGDSAGPPRRGSRRAA